MFLPTLFVETWKGPGTSSDESGRAFTVTGNMEHGSKPSMRYCVFLVLIA